MTGWEYVKEFYKQNFGIEDWVVELYANLDILQLCASGASNKSIVKFCDLDEDDVVEILMNTFNFPGWSRDLNINPYKWYLQDPKDEQTFKAALKTLVDVDADVVFNMCKTMKEIEERIADEWI